MAEQPKILFSLDDEAIRWQECAICGEQRQEVVHNDNTPDFAVCRNCESVFVLEDGGKMRMLYGKIGVEMPNTTTYALKLWRKYIDIRSIAIQERKPDDVVVDENEHRYLTQDDQYLSLEAQKSNLLYSQLKKSDSPRRLRETSELPNLDELFKDPE